MDMRRLVGRNVRRFRENKRLTQEKLAEISGFSQQYISSLEQGQRNPTVITLYELAVALGVNHIELVKPPRGRARRAAWDTWLGASGRMTALPLRCVVTGPELRSLRRMRQALWKQFRLQPACRAPPNAPVEQYAWILVQHLLRHSTRAQSG